MLFQVFGVGVWLVIIPLDDLKDIAKESGYAIGTVSRVLNNNPSVSPAARAKILEVIKRYNYQPNSNAKHHQ